LLTRQEDNAFLAKNLHLPLYKDLAFVPREIL